MERKLDLNLRLQLVTRDKRDNRVREGTRRESGGRRDRRHAYITIIDEKKRIDRKVR